MGLTGGKGKKSGNGSAVGPLAFKKHEDKKPGRSVLCEFAPKSGWTVTGNSLYVSGTEEGYEKG